MSDKSKNENQGCPLQQESLPDAKAEAKNANPPPSSPPNLADSQEEVAAAGTSQSQLPDPTPEELLALANDRYLRARADFENYRKRMAREFTDIRENARQQTLSEFLGIYDFFLLALEHTENATDLEAIRQGLRMIFAEFERVFDNLGVKVIETAEKDFDPSLHEAISQESSQEIPEGKIIRQWKPGFTLDGRLLRPASVVVSSGCPADLEAQEETDSKATSDR